MGAVVVYSHTGANDAEKRRNGMRDFGQQIITQSTTGPHANDNPKALHAAMKTILDAGTYDMKYGFTDSNGNEQGLTVYSVGNPPPAKQITCQLRDDAGDDAGTLRLQVEADGRSGSGNSAQYRMEVVFPDELDKNNYVYLDDAADDIVGLGAGGAAKTYLAAFKFMTRCK